MTFGSQESSRQDGSPLTLFFIRYGRAQNNFYALTNAEQEIVHNNNVTYKPLAVKHGSIKRLLTLDDARLTVTLPSDHELATRWRTYPPSEVTSIIIYQAHAENPDFKVVWLGRILGHKDVKDGASEFTCEPRSTSLLRSGLTRNWQLGCPLLLYSQGPRRCNADKEAATTSFTVVGVEGPLIYLENAWNALGDARQDYVTGMLEWTAADGRYEARSVLQVEEDGVIVLAGTAIGLTPGMSVDAVLGCNHRPYASEGGDCERLHNNIVNYGGQPYIPTENPIGIKNGFY